MKMQSKSISIVAVLAVALAASVAAWGDAASSAENPLEISSSENTLTVLNDKSPIFRYRHGNVPFKPYVRELFTPSGVNILRDAPHDHLHHHALMYGIAVDGVDFWAEKKDSGLQKQSALAPAKTDKIQNLHRVSFTQSLAWITPESKKALLESRTIETYQGADLKPTLLTWQSMFTLPKGTKSAELTGSHYFGLGMRFVESMDKGGTFLNAEGKNGVIVRGAERNVDSRWCAYVSEAEGKPVTVAMFGHPDNPRHPATWFTMPKPFAYMSATLNLHKKPMEMKAGEPLTVRYGVALWDGKIEDGEIEELYRWWIEIQDVGG